MTLDNAILSFSPKNVNLTLRSRADIDLESREWRVSVERMEHKREYRAPWSARVLEILVEGGENSIGSEWVFPSPGGWVRSGLDFSDLLRDLALSGVLSVRLMWRRLNGRSCYTRSDRRLVHDRLHDLGEPWCSMRRQHDLLH